MTATPDRVSPCCDETGALIDGDDIMAICAQDMLAQGSLAQKTVVSTVMSNAGLDAFVRKPGATMARTAVGDQRT